MKRLKKKYEGQALAPQMVEAIHRMRDKGLSQASIAAHLGIDRRTVSKYMSPEDRRRVLDLRNAYDRRRRAALKEENNEAC